MLGPSEAGPSGSDPTLAVPRSSALQGPQPGWLRGPPRDPLLPEVLPTEPLVLPLSLLSRSQPCPPFLLSFQHYQVLASAIPLGMEVRRWA